MRLEDFVRERLTERIALEERAAPFVAVPRLEADRALLEQANQPGDQTYWMCAFARIFYAHHPDYDEGWQE